ncbi:MAG: phage N-6-adenine-methyltransferase, partial [Sinobacteraceae bacterium]|nr:phage N-6-adenine-methyltransferase [Nevskiaceae bacterium]
PAEPGRRGRPRIHEDQRAAWRFNSRAYRARERKKKQTKPYHRHDSDEWGTPPDLWQAVLLAMGLECFDLDPCSPSHTGPVPARKRFTREDDSLKQSWVGQVWCNPPYSQLAKWVHKCRDAALEGATVMALVPARTDTRCWQHDIAGSAAVLLLPGRLRFLRLDGGTASAAPFPSALVFFGGDDEIIWRCQQRLGGQVIPRLDTGARSESA